MDGGGDGDTAVTFGGGGDGDTAVVFVVVTVTQLLCLVVVKTKDTAVAFGGGGDGDNVALVVVVTVTQLLCGGDGDSCCVWWSW